jgi:hypothetical protein
VGTMHAEKKLLPLLQLHVVEMTRRWLDARAGKLEEVRHST